MNTNTHSETHIHTKEHGHTYTYTDAEYNGISGAATYLQTSLFGESLHKIKNENLLFRLKKIFCLQSLFSALLVDHQL